MELPRFDPSRQTRELRLAKPLPGRPNSVSPGEANVAHRIPDKSYAAFPALDNKRTASGERRLRMRSSGPSWLRVVFYVLFAGVVWFLATPSNRSYLSTTEKAMLVDAQDVAELTRSFVPVLGFEKYEGRRHWIGLKSWSYQYSPTDPRQPEIACLVEQTSGIAKALSGSSVASLLREFDWRTQTADNRGLVQMPDAPSLGDSSQIYFIYENDRPVGNVVIVGTRETTLSLILGGVVLMDGREVERLLAPVLERIRALPVR